MHFSRLLTWHEAVHMKDVNYVSMQYNSGKTFLLNVHKDFTS